jgi:hypothetical protein
MKFPKIFQMIKPNIDTKGRIVRASMALMLLGLALYGYVTSWSFWIFIPVALGGILAGYEAARGWCVVRACGIKTRF